MPNRRIAECLRLVRGSRACRHRWRRCRQHTPSERSRNSWRIYRTIWSTGTPRPLAHATNWGALCRPRLTRPWMSWKKRAALSCLPRFGAGLGLARMIRPFVGLVVSWVETNSCPRCGNGRTTNGLGRFIDSCPFPARFPALSTEPGDRVRHGSPDRPCDRLSALRQRSTRVPYPFRARRDHPCWRSHAAFLATSRRILDVPYDW